MATLDLSKSGYGIEVLSYYLWGQATAPNKSEIANGKWLQRNKEITLNVSAKEYMKYVDKYTSAANFGIFQKFFDNKVPHPTGIAGTTMVSVPYTKEQMYSVGATINSDGFYELDIRQMGDIIYGKGKNPFFVNNQYKELSTDISHYTLDVNSNNYAERAFVFGSSDMTFTTKDVKFLINAKTFKPEFIDNLQIKPAEDDFNFEGGGVIAKVANHYLNKLTDPSGIGKTVQINFTDKDKIDHIKVSKDDFNKLKVKFDNSKNLTPNLDAYEKYFNNTIIKSGVIDYLDENNKLVMFGSNNSDSMVNTQATNMNFNEALYSGFVDIYNHYISSYYGKGITYVGGKGSDTIIGTKFDDILYSNDNTGVDDNSPDILKGGDGYDTYHAGDKDIIIDSDHNGEVIFDGIKLNGGVWDENKQAYIDSSNNSISYKLNESTLTLTILKGNKTLTIKNYDINKQSLNISLSKNPGKEVAIVIDTTGSMYDDIEAAKESAKAIAQNIFRSNLNNNEPNNKNSEVYSKISIVTFSDNNIKILGSYNNYNSFQKGINQVYEQGGGREYHCAAILEGMSNFTKDNGLSKEIYLMTDESGDDNHRMSEVINKAKNFGSSISLRSAFNYKSKFDNSVKINIISINNNHLNLKRLSDETNGLYLQPNNIDELKDALFDISNQGTSKDETIIGNDKNNTINGKGGNDTLKGLKGDDTYLFEGSFENDTIIDNEGKNKIIFKDRSVNDIDFVKVKSDLLLIDYKTKGGPLNYVKVINFFNNDKAYKNKTPNITSIKFKDYTINEDTLTFMSNSSSNTYNFLNDTSNNFYINKGKGKFIVGHKNKENLITTNNYDDVVIGGDKNDIIKTNSGNDVIIGKKGDDILISRFGNDTYIFNLGDGNDTIIDNKGKDTIKFNGDIKNLNFTKIADDLIIKYSLKDSVTIKNHFKNRRNNISKIEFNNNSYIKDLHNITKELNQNNIVNNNNLDKNNLSNLNKNLTVNLDNNINSFISQNQINKIIQDLNSYSDDNAINFNFSSEFKNNDIMQVYNS